MHILPSRAYLHIGAFWGVFDAAHIFQFFVYILRNPGYKLRKSVLFFMPTMSASFYPQVNNIYFFRRIILKRT
jgi:hypothetical protein